MNQNVDNNRMYKGLIFDLDGVIVDTAKYHYLAWKALADELNIQFTKKDNERLKGVSRVQSFQILLDIGGVEMTKEEQEVYCTKKNDVYLERIHTLKPEDTLPGVYEFLKHSRDKGYKIALGSASKNASFILERLKLVDMFDVIVDGTHVSKAKPDPEVFLKGAEGMGLVNKECIVFEDAVAGIKAAHAAGMKAVGIGTENELPQAQLHILSFEGLTTDDVEGKLKVV